MRPLTKFILALFLATSTENIVKFACEKKKGKEIEVEKKIVLSQDSLSLWDSWIKKTIEISDSWNCPAIIVSKLDRKLNLYINGKYDTSFPITLFNYTEPKVRMGDCKTPEGLFYVTYMGKHPIFEYVIQISYPDTIAGKIGLEKGIITEEEFKKIKKAIEAGKKPPMNTGLGGDICIHGTNATIGCIAIGNNIGYVYNKIKKYFYSFYNKKVLVTIVRGTKKEYPFP